MTDIDDLEDFIKEFKSEYEDEYLEITPGDGVRRFIDSNGHMWSECTVREYEVELERFASYLREKGIESLHELSGGDIEDYRNWRRTESSDVVDVLSRKTMRDEMYLLRNFIGYLERIEAVKPKLSEKVTIPKLRDNDGVRNRELEAERLVDILDHLEKYEYASRDHVIFQLKKETGRRKSGLRALDLEDLVLHNDDPYLMLKHRPPSTPLKNDEDSEAKISLSEETAEILSDYIENNRIEKRDDEGREPLLTTSHGRISKTTLTKTVYRWTRPCIIGNDCPDNRNPETCEAAQSVAKASMCPASRSPHDIRHGHVSEARRNGFPLELLSDRIDAEPETIKKHYDESTNEERYQVRKELWEKLDRNGGGYL